MTEKLLTGTLSLNTTNQIMPRVGARCQNLGHLKKCYVAFSLVLIPSNNIMTVIRHPYDLGLLCHEVKVSVTGLYFIVEWFCLISWRLFDGLMSNIWIMSQCDATFDLKINVGHSDLYFMFQWFCPISWRLFDIWRLYLRYWISMTQKFTS